MKTLLLIIDPQVDFISGSLPVSGAAEAMNELGKLIEQNPEKFTEIIVTLDSHLPEHISFKSRWENDMEKVPKGLDLWPDHCVIGTPGHSIHEPLLQSLEVYKKETGHPHRVVMKGNNPEEEMYSAIGYVVEGYLGGLPYAPEINENLLGEYDEIYVAGIARDFCVASTVQDLLVAFPRQTRGKVKLMKDYMPFIVNDEPNIFKVAIQEMWASYV